jgi:hypothetical protein
MSFSLATFCLWLILISCSMSLFSCEKRNGSGHIKRFAAAARRCQEGRHNPQYIERSYRHVSHVLPVLPLCSGEMFFELVYFTAGGAKTVRGSLSKPLFASPETVVGTCCQD